jgi:hypothetical protein
MKLYCDPADMLVFSSFIRSLVVWSAQIGT